MTIYNVLVEYQHFEDEDSNYSEIRGSFSTLEKAEEETKKALKDELANGMNFYGNSTMNKKDYPVDKMLKEDREIILEQDFGEGEARLFISINALDKHEESEEI